MKLEIQQIGFLIGFVFLFVTMIALVRKARADSRNELCPIIPFTPATGEFVLMELEAAAPHLFQLRKVGIKYEIGFDARQSLLAVDAGRAARVFDIIDGQVTI